MIKLFPIVSWRWPRAGCGGAGSGAPRCAACSSCAGVIAAISAPFLGAGYVDAYRYHVDRPVQIESTPASVLWALGGTRVTGHDRAARPRSAPTGWSAAPRAPCSALFARARARRAARPARCWPRGGRDERQLLLCAAAAVVAFVALGKVFSPQYVAWLAPFAALLLAARERLAAGLIALARSR